VVGIDEKEGGLRAILNLGHTFGHAIETHQGYGTWLHGEAVGAGMIMAAELSCLMGWLPDEDVQRIRSLVMRAGLPVSGPEGMLEEDYLSLMSVDKKVMDGGLRLVLLKSIGDAVVTDAFSQDALIRVLKGN
jgi:3-dehydroquinate synthase